MSQCLTLNSEQEHAISVLREFLKSKTQKIIVLEGYAGTGKSTIISHLFKDPDYSKMNVCMSATTNKAVSVLKEMGKIDNKKIDYLTIHKLMRIKRTIDSDGKQQFITSFNETTDSRVVLQNKGSDTLVNVAQAWAEAYKEVNPNTAVAVSGGGSGTGVSALLNGTVDLANSSRSLKQKELDLAEKKGFSPKANIVGYDALAIFLHPSNAC